MTEVNICPGCGQPNQCASSKGESAESLINKKVTADDKQRLNNELANTAHSASGQKYINRSTHLSPQLLPYIDSATRELVMFSPYPVPGKEGVNYFSDLVSRGVRVVLITNSLASLFVGSLNLDPRSALLNTEIGAIYDTPEMAEEFVSGLSQLDKGGFWELKLMDNDIQWLECNPECQVISNKDPESSVFTRMGIFVLSLLPIEQPL